MTKLSNYIQGYIRPLQKLLYVGWRCHMYVMKQDKSANIHNSEWVNTLAIVGQGIQTCHFRLKLLFYNL